MILTAWKNLLKLAYVTVQGRFLWNFVLYGRRQRDCASGGALRRGDVPVFAFVLQGPWVHDADFTLETLKLYRDHFPGALLILSTWDVPEAARSVLRTIAVHLIVNEPPQNPGISNMNMQIVSARAGILAAGKLGARYVLKTRTDQRIYHPSLDTYLLNLVEMFPAPSEFPMQRSRLVGISLNTFKYRMYGVSDMFMFGDIDDMKLYWDIPLDERRDSQEERQKGIGSSRRFTNWRVCEVYFCTEFLKKVGRDLQFTLADSYRSFRDHFVIIDKWAIRLYWHKYQLNVDRYSSSGVFDPELTFNDWLTIYHALDQINIDERVLD